MIKSPHSKIDLHSHTNASDGFLSPIDLIDRAIENGIDLLAITDHDTINGYLIAKQYLSEVKHTHSTIPLTLIPGIEISCIWNDREIHVVGLGIDTQNSFLKEQLEAQQSKRVLRATLINKRLEKKGIIGALNYVEKLTQGETISRAHFAKFLIEQNYVKSMNNAFKKYLGKSGMAYVPPQWMTMENAINLIHHCGGLAVIAHPLRYELSTLKLQQLLVDFKTLHGDAIEVSQSNQSHDDMVKLAKYALEFNFMASQGSDFHYFGNNIELGKVYPLPDDVKPIWQSLAIKEYNT